MSNPTYIKCKDAKWGMIEGKSIVAKHAEDASEFLTEEEKRKLEQAVELIGSVCFGLEQQMSTLLDN